MQKKRMAQETRKKNMCAAKNSQKIMSTRSAQNKYIAILRMPGSELG